MDPCFVKPFGRSAARSTLLPISLIMNGCVTDDHRRIWRINNAVDFKMNWNQ